MTERFKMSFLAHPWPEALGTRSKGFLPSQQRDVEGMVEPSLSTALHKKECSALLREEVLGWWGWAFSPSQHQTVAGLDAAPFLPSLLPGSHSGQHNLLLLQVLPWYQETWHHAGTWM